MLTEVISMLKDFVPFLLTIAAVMVALALVNWALRRRWRDNPEAQFRFQMIMLALTLAGLLTIVIALPIDETLRGQLLSLIGILLSAAIALSSTTFIGNIMAGIMLKAVGHARPGDFITVNDLTGRITEMGLLHTEIQTEFRDLVTLPNLYMVTHPLQVVRSSGTIITAEVSLGYDVPNSEVEAILQQATNDAGLTEGFVQVRELGDFSITYRVAGLLEDVKSLISARSKLRTAMLDALHEAGVEIVSPNFMNTRSMEPGLPIIPKAARKSDPSPGTKAEDIAFDKANNAEIIEDMRKSIEGITERLDEKGEDGVELTAHERTRLESKRTILIEQLQQAELALEEEERAGKGEVG